MYGRFLVWKKIDYNSLFSNTYWCSPGPSKYRNVFRRSVQISYSLLNDRIQPRLSTTPVNMFPMTISPERRLQIYVHNIFDYSTDIWMLLTTPKGGAYGSTECSYVVMLICWFVDLVVCVSSFPKLPSFSTAQKLLAWDIPSHDKVVRRFVFNESSRHIVHRQPANKHIHYILCADRKTEKQMHGVGKKRVGTYKLSCRCARVNIPLYRIWRWSSVLARPICDNSETWFLFLLFLSCSSLLGLDFSRIWHQYPR
jgi:hypothetical protein